MSSKEQLPLLMFIYSPPPSHDKMVVNISLFSHKFFPLQVTPSQGKNGIT